MDMDEEIFLKECEEKVSIEADYVLRNLERFAEEEMLEFDWIVYEFKKQLNRKIKERGIKDDLWRNENKHQEEYDTFAKDKIFYIFTSSKEEFEKKLKEYGLNGEDICSIGYGGFIKRKIRKN